MGADLEVPLNGELGRARRGSGVIRTRVNGGNCSWNKGVVWIGGSPLPRYQTLDRYTTRARTRFASMPLMAGPARKWASVRTRSSRRIDFTLDRSRGHSSGDERRCRETVYACRISARRRRAGRDQQRSERRRAQSSNRHGAMSQRCDFGAPPSPYLCSGASDLRPWSHHRTGGFRRLWAGATAAGDRLDRHPAGKRRARCPVPGPARRAG